MSDLRTADRAAARQRPEPLPREAPGAEPAWHLYVVRTPAPDALYEALGAEGIGARGYYRVPTHEQPAMREYAPAVALPGTAQAARSNLALPMSPVLSGAQVEQVVGAARRHLASVPVGS